MRCGGGPLYEGLRVGVPSQWNAARVEYVEFGKVTKDGQIAVVAPSGLRIVNAGAAYGTAGVTVLPPTDGGWRAFLDAAPGSGLKFGELAEAGKWWWGRSIPRHLLSGDEGVEDDAREAS